MEQFPHLKFKQRISGLPRFHPGGVQDPRTLENKENRQEHGNFLHTGTSKIKSDWEEALKQRDKTGFAQIDESTVPVFLQINPDIISPDFNLESYGIEIIAEEEDGYIIGASQDKLRTLEEKIAGFITAEHGTGKIADFWQIIDGKREEWKPRHILSEFLYSKWNEIADDEFYRVEVSVAFSKPIGKEPDPNKVGGKRRRHRYEEKLIERDELLMQRQNHFDQFIMHYGKRVSSFIELEDSFACEVEINGLGLKDLVVNYQYVFEVSEIDEIFGIEGHESNLEEFELELISPDDDSVEVGVIDSGIMENHKYLAPGIKSENSKSYTGDKSTADYVQGGGHGTKVAGAIFYPRGVNEIESPYKLPCFIRNLKVLNEHNKLHHNYPAKLIQQVIEDNDECMIFNLSLCSESPCRIKHMSTWAAIIDKLSFENNILFIISAGNIRFPVIRGFLSDQVNYPDYLEEGNCRIANPAQSLFSLTVGSINPSGYEDEFWKSLGVEDEISAFSRIGPGIWDSVKPDVVEYGGGVVLSKDGLHLIREHEVTSPELIRSTMHGGSAIGRDSVGTSFSAPKIAHIAAVLKHLYPDDHINLIKALVA
ncbi:MAG: S8 family peptidase, partial [Bacteroidota bacterium]